MNHSVVDLQGVRWENVPTVYFLENRELQLFLSRRIPYLRRPYSSLSLSLSFFFTSFFF
jgi:hypothetical protein